MITRDRFIIERYSSSAFRFFATDTHFVEGGENILIVHFQRPRGSGGRKESNAKIRHTIRVLRFFYGTSQKFLKDTLDSKQTRFLMSDVRKIDIALTLERHLFTAHFA